MIQKFLMVAPVLLICLALPVSAQRDHPVAQAFSAAIIQTDMNSLTALLDDEVELMQPGANGTYRKQVASGKVADFLRQNPPSQFMVKHQGSSADGQVYAIGQLTTRSGGNYKVVLRARPNAGQPGAAQPNAAQPGVAHYKIFKLDFLQNL
ncbi:hypothetical protein D770_08830 [Flammeovirgaceae bacterium 311]|nr:hypothetical protein D770_08830 [Flammeovirgaceae bacterium 311]